MLNIKKFTKLVILFSFAISLVFIIAPKEFSAATVTYLTDMKPEDGKINANKWYINYKYQSFEDLSGNLVSGIGLKDESDSAYVFAEYNIEEMNYTSFDTQITLDKKWSVGDYGKSAVGIYADGHQLLERQVSVNSGVMDVHLDIPSGSKYLTLVVSELKGTKGNHGVILKDARLSTGGKVVTINDEETKLENILSSEESGKINFKKWALPSGCCYTTVVPFQDSNGNIITSGLGMYENRGTARIKYNIDQLGYNVFETKLTLDSKWTIGDYGKTAVAIFADDYKLYEKQMIPGTSVQSLRLKIPKGTKNLYLVTKQAKGAKGERRVIFIHPVLKKTSETQPVLIRSASVQTVGDVDHGDYTTGDWNDRPLQYENGNLVTSGVGFRTGWGWGYDESFATYDITGMNFNTFTANLSLDFKWIIGDYGKTKIYFYANNRLIYSQNVTRGIGIKPLFLHLPSGTTSVKIYVDQEEGNLGYQGVVLGDAQFKYHSYTPNLSTAQLKATNNTGNKDVVTISNVLKGDIIKVYNSSGKLIASPTATGSTVTLYIPQLGTKSGKLYIAAKRGTSLDSVKTAVTFAGEKTSTAKLKTVSIKNNKNKSDTITVSGLLKYDTIYVYSSTGKYITSKKTSSSTVTIYINQLGHYKGSIFLAAKGDGMTTSSKVKVTFKGE